MLKATRTLYFFALLAFSVQCLAAPTQEEVDAATRTKAVAEASQATADATKATADALKATAESRKAVAEFEVAEARAKLGTLDLSKLSAVTAEAKTLNIEGNLLAYASVQTLAKQIAASIAPHTKSKVVVLFTENELKFIEQVQPVSSNLQALDMDIDNLIIPRLEIDNPKCAADEAGGGPGLLGSIDVASQVLSVFKTNTKSEGVDVTTDSFALSAAVAAELKQAKVRVVYPPLFSPGLALGAYSKSNVEQALDNIAMKAGQIDRILANIDKQKDQVKKRKEAMKKPTPQCKSAFDKAEKTLEQTEGKANALKSRVEKYLTLANSFDEKTGKTMLQSLVAAEALRKAAADGYLLQIKPISAGGTTTIKTSFFRSSTRFSGGAIVAYMLISGTDGAILDSGVVGAYGGYVKAGELSSGIVNAAQSPEK
ncbi:hypothetical protein ACHAC9_20640 [Massilia sp. CMS3.1]|uniref:hypothetical protein n=1 Tax=Massilia sp. CMS3.1 TaxID=3373083 RepID=UPI003EE7BE1F